MATIGLNACGGGGGGGGGAFGSGGGPNFSLNTNTLTFAAADPYATDPPAQTITGTVQGSLSGTLYIVIAVNGNAVQSVGNLSINGNTGQATVTPISAGRLGPGSYASSISVRACLNDETCATGQLPGSPQIVNVTYTVGGIVPPDAVMPRVVTAGAPGQVVIRGTGLSGVSSVSFGSTQATSVSVVSGTEVRASYPASLPAQVLPVTLNGGAVPFAGSVIALAPQTYGPQTLGVLQTPQRIKAVVHDAERHALFVLAAFTQSSANQLWRYTESAGIWSATPQVTAIPELRDISLSNDGSKLLVLTGYAIEERDPANPGAGAQRVIPAPFPPSTKQGSRYFGQFAVANDGHAVVATAGLGTSGFSETYIYSSTKRSFSQLPATLHLYAAVDGEVSPMLNGSPDGSVVLAVMGGLNPDPAVLAYNSSVSFMAETTLRAEGDNDQEPMIDGFANKRMFWNAVYDSSYQRTGTLSGSFRAFTMNRAGTRAYALHLNNSLLHTYDLTTTTNGAHPEIGVGTAVTLPVPIGSPSAQLKTSPDGLTLFVVGVSGVVVVPL